MSIFSVLMLLGLAVGSVFPRSAAEIRVSDLASQEPFSSGLVGVLAVKMSGDTVVSYNASQRLVPASNVKLLTTGVALDVLGPDFRFETALGYRGQLRDSTLVGDLYIVGGGDPTTGSKSDCAEPAELLFRKWKAILTRNGINRIEGKVIADPRFFRASECYSWDYGDIGTYYGILPTGLNFFENAQNFSVTPGAEVGDPVLMEPFYPVTPWMTYANTCTTSPAGCGDEMVYVNTDLAPVGELRGHYAVDRRKKLLECSNRFGAYTCAAFFCKYLRSSGIAVTGGWADVAPSGMVRTDLSRQDGPEADAPENLSILGKTYSPALADIVRDTNHNSDNFFAEAVFRMVGKTLAGSAEYDSCYVAASAALGKLGVRDLSGYRQRDGSGLSRMNYVSPEFFVTFLTAMTSRPCFPAFLNSLPVPGGPGTLEYRMKSTPEAVKSRIHMKSGSMGGVRCFSGYILSKDGDPSKTIVFSLLTNNVTAGSWTTGMLIDDMIASIAAEN